MGLVKHFNQSSLAEFSTHDIHLFLVQLMQVLCNKTETRRTQRLIKIIQDGVNWFLTAFRLAQSILWSGARIAWAVNLSHFTGKVKRKLSIVCRGVTRGGTIPRAPIHYGSAESLKGRRITGGGAEKSQQCHKYFLQYSKFAFERTQIYRGAKLRPGGAPNLFLAPGAI